jgi:uncharacterized protein
LKIIVAGATGFIGRAVVAALRDRSDQVVALSRNVPKAQQALGPNVEILEWNPPQSGPWMEAFNGADGVVNVSGEQVVSPFEPWTRAKKERILSSRVDPTTAIVGAIRQADPRPPVLINQSAIGYYGSQGDTILTESSPPGADFLAYVVERWEVAAKPVEEVGVRLVLLRTGIVLGRGGELPLLALPFRFFAGGTMGSPTQWLSWIDLEDEVGLIVYALGHETLRGPVNATSPNPVTMDIFSRQIGKALNRPSWVPMLDVAMRIGLGERSQAILASQRVLPEAARAAGYQFRHVDSEESLRRNLA